MGKKKVHTAEVVHHGDAIVLPEGMKLKAGIEVLIQKLDYESTVVDFRATINGFVPDVAHAFHMTLASIYGWANNVPQPGFWGDSAPDSITVDTGLDTSVQVPWGMFKLPNIGDGWLATSMTEDEGRKVVLITGHMQRQYEAQFQRIITQTREYLGHSSLYRGAAFRIRVKDDYGEVLPMPDPKFLKVNRSIKDELIFSEEVDTAIRVSVFAPIKNREKARSLGVPTKRGILLYGPFGTGKSMTSAVVADIATANDWTFILCERADELVDVLRMAQNYSPAVVFCEDVDKVFSGSRTVGMDELLNMVDGVESKDSEVMVIFTTNAIHEINRAALRPGRLDAVIEVKPPDPVAVAKLIHLYGRGIIEEGSDIGPVCDMLAGEIPAVIQEVVERSKLGALDRDPGAVDVVISAHDLEVAAGSMKNQLELLRGKEPDARSEREKAAAITAEAIRAIGPVPTAPLNGQLHATKAAAV